MTSSVLSTGNVGKLVYGARWENDPMSQLEWLLQRQV